MIEIDVMDEEDEVVMTLQEIAGVALAIAKVCVLPPELGGRERVPETGVGARRMWIKVLGIDLAVGKDGKIEGNKMLVGGLRWNGTTIGTERRRGVETRELGVSG